MNIKALLYFKSGFKPWHPDFYTLPQKTEIEARHRFWEKTITISCFGILGILGWFVFQNRLLQNELHEQNLSLAKLEPYNKKLLKENQAFLTIKNQIDAIYDFVSPTSQWLQLLNTICEHKQEDVIFSNFDLKWVTPPKDKKAKTTPPSYLTLTIKGSVQGSTDQALTSLEHYKESFNTIDLLKNNIQSLEVNHLARQKALDWMDFEILLHLKPFVL